MGSNPTPESDQNNHQPFLVVTGSSAGGIDALTAFVSQLKDDLPVSVVVAQHLAPQASSRLADILARRTAWRVETVETETDLKAGTIYVVPPGHDVEILDASVATRLHVKRGPQPSIDRLFSSAAAVYRERVIAIILSGLGSDGVAGARVVKEAGGTVLVQDPKGAGFPTLPMAVPPTLIDMSLPPEAMVKVITDLVADKMPKIDGNDKKLVNTLLTQLRERSGIDFSQYKMPTIMRRLSRLMIASGVNSVGEYISYLQRTPDGYQRLVNSFLIKVTEFFRDTALFDLLREEILPELIAQARENGRELRIWSAGTSTGEEAYSLAILCAELMREEDNTIEVRIFATDVDDQAIAFARHGVYAANVLSDVPKELIDRYFTKLDDHYEIAKKIRNMTVFGQHDLGQRAPFPRVDLCLCRNVLIYFTKELQTRALQLFAFALRDGGYLALGKAESTSPLPQFFHPFNATLKIYQREGDRVLLPPTPLKGGGTQPAPLPNFLRAGLPRETRVPSVLDFVAVPIMDKVAAYANSCVVGFVVVDNHYDIISINSAARSMLQIHGVGVGSDLVHLLPATGRQVRTLLDAALERDRVDPIVILAQDPVTSIDRWLQIFAYADPNGHSTPTETAGLVIIDVTRYELKLREVEETRKVLEASLHAQSGRNDELSVRLKAVLTANDELIATNADMRTYNEQLLINSEEAASANEEIETLNEELQATNEELETLNEELQATIEELNTTNDELEARSGELERANTLGQQRMARADAASDALRLALDAAGTPCAVVDGDGKILYMSRPFSDLSALSEATKRWWLQPSMVRLPDQQEYATAVKPLGDGSLTLVTFNRVKKP